MPTPQDDFIELWLAGKVKVSPAVEAAVTKQLAANRDAQSGLRQAEPYLRHAQESARDSGHIKAADMIGQAWNYLGKAWNTLDK
jgi:hypothetical protein